MCRLRSRWIIFLAWTAVFLRRAEYLSAVVALGFAMFAAGFVGVAIVVRSGRVTPRVVSEGAGTVVRPDRRPDVLLMAATVGVLTGIARWWAVRRAGDAPATRKPLSPNDSRRPRHGQRDDVRGAIVG